MSRGAVRARHFCASTLSRRIFPRSPCGRRRYTVIELQPRRLNLPDVAACRWRRTIYRSVLRLSRCAPVITCCTAGRESRNSRAMAAGFRPASQAARISRSCPGVSRRRAGRTFRPSSRGLSRVRSVPTVGVLPRYLAARRVRAGEFSPSPPSPVCPVRRRPAGGATGRSRPAGRGPAPLPGCRGSRHGRLSALSGPPVDLGLSPVAFPFGKAAARQPAVAVLAPPVYSSKGIG